MHEDHQIDQHQVDQTLLLQQQLQLFEQEPLVEAKPAVLVPRLPTKTTGQFHEDDDLGDGFDCCR